MRQVLEMLSSAFKMAPDVVRRSMQDANLRREALRELRSTLVTTDVTPDAAKSAASGVTVPPLRKVEGSTVEETAAEVKKREEEARAAVEAKRKEEEAKAAEANRKEEEARAAAEATRREEEAKAAEAKRKAEVEKKASEVLKKIAEDRAAEAKRKEEEARAAEAKRKEEEANAAEEKKRKEEEARVAEAKRKEEEAKTAEAKRKEEEANSKRKDAPAEKIADAASPLRSLFRSFNLNLRGLSGLSEAPARTLEESSRAAETKDDEMELKAQSTPALRGSEPSAPLAVPSAQESELPGEVKVPSSGSVGEWLPATDQATGNTYYWNTVTREVTWDLPERD